jgi:hypothetical protein
MVFTPCFDPRDVLEHFGGKEYTEPGNDVAGKMM